MDRMTQRVGVGEAIPATEFTEDICEPYVRAGKCKTGLMRHSDGKYGWQRHCNDQCAVGKLIDRLAAYEDTGLTPDEIVALRAENERLRGLVDGYAEEAKSGRLIKLPCGVGDTVYDLWYSPCRHGETHPDSSGCCGCEDECDMKRVVRPVQFQSIQQILARWREFETGWYYMTEEAARAALEGGQQ